MKVLPREFYLRDAATVAKELLGKILIHRLEEGAPAVEITETEAYLGASDPACHSYGGRRTGRTQVMYGPGGYAYVYLIYGMYHMLNAVTGRENDPCAVLIRGGRPIGDRDMIAINRFGKPYQQLSRAKICSLCDGPGKLARALALGREHNGLDLCDSPLLICQGGGDALKIEAGPRIGIDYAGEAASWPLNFRLME